MGSAKAANVASREPAACLTIKLNISRSQPYVNKGEYFEDMTVAQGLGEPSRSGTGFGLGFADFDHDGHRDIYIVNGRVRYGRRNLIPEDANAEPNQLFRGLRDGRFSEMTTPGGVNKSLITTSRAAAFGDLDNDGDIDIVVINRDAPAYLLRNIVGSRGHWIMFRVLDKRGVDAVGAIVELEAGGRRQLRTVQTAYSYQASNDPRVHFGLADLARVSRVRVRWPSGRPSFETTLGANFRYTNHDWKEAIQREWPACLFGDGSR